MGNAAAAAREPPAGGVLLPVAWGTVGATTCPGAVAANFASPFERPAFDHSRPALPGLGEEAWEEFARDARGAAARMWPSGAEVLALVIVLPLLLLTRATLPKISTVVVAVSVLAVVSLSCLCRRQNEGRDAELQAACERLAASSGGRLRVEYRTLYTGVCRPRGTQPFRAVAIAPIARGP